MITRKQLAKKLEYGLKLVKDRAGMDSFSITGEAVNDMEKYINNLVKTYYRHKPELVELDTRDDATEEA